MFEPLVRGIATADGTCSTGVQQTLASVATETDRQNRALHASTNELHAREVRFGEIQTRIAQKAVEEAGMGERVREVSALAGTLKVSCIFTGICVLMHGFYLKDLSVKIGNADEAINELKARHHVVETALDAQRKHAERSMQELNAHIERFNVCHRTVEQYVPTPFRLPFRRVSTQRRVTHTGT